MPYRNWKRKRPHLRSWAPRAWATRVTFLGFWCVLVSLTSASQAAGQVAGTGNSDFQFDRLSEDVDGNGIHGAALTIDPVTGSVSTLTDFGDIHYFDFYPPYHDHQLPEPLAHFGRQQLQTLGPNSFEGLLNQAATFSAWAHVPEGKVVELFRREGYLGTSAVGIASTTVLGESAAGILNEPSETLPDYFVYLSEFDRTESVKPYSISIVSMPNLQSVNADAADWQHLALFNWWNLGIWTAYEENGEISLLFSSTPPGFNRILYTSRLPTITLESQFPFWTAGQVGGEIGDLIFYPGLLSPGLVNQLAVQNPFAAPEPSSTLLLISALALSGAAGHCRRVRRERNSHAPKFRAGQSWFGCFSKRIAAR